MAQPTPDLPPRYALWPSSDRALLGKGGAGEVWRAKDQELGVLVALKVLRAEGARIRARLEREAVLASRVVHPHVVALHDMGQTPSGHPYLAFALASDGSLLEHLRVLPAWPDLRRFTLGLLEALGALHSRGILHLDVKLSNLLLHRAHPKQQTLWLADLGVARALHGEEDDDSAVIGTVAYMAAERLSGQVVRWGPATDLFSVGAVLYRILTGELPFPQREPPEALKARARPPTSLPVRPGYKVPDGIDRVILPLLALHPAERFDIAADVIRALRSLPPLEGEAPSEPTTGPIAPMGAPFGVPAWHRPAPYVLPPKLPREPLHRRPPVSPLLLQHREIPMVGREQELDRLWGIARQVAQTRHPAIIQIDGARGVGRTRLAREFTRILEEEGMGEGVLVQNAVREGPALGLRGAWRRVFPPQPDRRTWVKDIAYVLARDGQAPVPSTQGPAERLAQWIQPQHGERAPDRALPRAAMVEHLVHRSWRGLSWLLIEDAHLAHPDDELWDVLEMLFVRTGPVLVIATTRADAPLPAPLVDLRARHGKHTHTLDLAPLGDEHAQELVDAHLPLDPELTRRLAKHTGGNPRYLLDLLLHWIRLGALEQRTSADTGEQRWSLKAPAPPLPIDRHDFAKQRLSEALTRHPEWLGPLLTIAIAGRGTPERVIARVTGPVLDQLVVEGLVNLERGSPVLVPPELPEAVRQSEHDPEVDRVLHEHLATAWSAEGDDPVVLAAVGRHRALAGQDEAALDPLYRALRGLDEALALPERIDLARQTMEVAARVTGRGSHAWAQAALTLGQALWFLGRGEEALALDEDLAKMLLPADEMIRAACQHASHIVDGRQGLARLAKVEDLVAGTDESVQARFFAQRGRCKARMLDNEGALQDLDHALRLAPDPETETTCTLGISMLLSARDPSASYEMALHTIDVAARHGLVRNEVAAWGIAGEHLVGMGRTTEAIDRLETGIQRLQAQGEYRMVGNLLVSLGEVLRAAGRHDDARRAYSDALQSTRIRAPQSDVASLARANLAILAALARDHQEILRLHEEDATAEGTLSKKAWELLEPLAQVLSGADVPAPADEVLAQAARLGPDGVLLGRLIAVVLEERGRTAEGARIEAIIAQAAKDEQVDATAVHPLVFRFRQAR